MQSSKSIYPLFFLLSCFLIFACQDTNAAKEAELLKRENELLKQENELLKKEKELAEQQNAASKVTKEHNEKEAGPQAAVQDDGLVRVGTHNLTLQWISWDHPGKAVVTSLGGNRYQVKGEQLSKENDDYLKIDGVITAVSKQELQFEGTIEYKVNHISNGTPCVKKGKKIFKSRGTRKYWRLQDLKNCTDITTDYVDLYF